MANATTAPKDINLSKYVKLPEAEIYFDPRPRIRNIVRELEEEHEWTWPPQPPPDFEKVQCQSRACTTSLLQDLVKRVRSGAAIRFARWRLHCNFFDQSLPQSSFPGRSLVFGRLYLIIKRFIFGLQKRVMKRRKWTCLYRKECLDICSILAMIIGPWELLVAFGFCILPKTFVPAIRESAEFCMIFVGIYAFQGLKHVFAALVGFSLRSMKPWRIGFVHVTYPYEIVWPLLGLFVSAVGFYTTQEWRVENEMEHTLKSYSSHWFSTTGWDYYQGYMKCCGVNDYKDWQRMGASLSEGHLVPGSCCDEGSCPKDEMLASAVHTWGCLEITTKSTLVLLVSGTICMVVGLFLAIMGFRSMREAENCIGDPIHNLLFDNSSTNVVKSRNRAARRQELLELLDHYCLQVGEEMGLKKEVQKAKDYLGLGGEPFPKQKMTPKPEVAVIHKTQEKPRASPKVAPVQVPSKKPVTTLPAPVSPSIVEEPEEPERLDKPDDNPTTPPPEEVVKPVTEPEDVQEDKIDDKPAQGDKPETEVVEEDKPMEEKYKPAEEETDKISIVSEQGENRPLSQTPSAISKEK